MREGNKVPGEFVRMPPSFPPLAARRGTEKY